MSIIFSDITIETFVKLLKESNNPSLICGNGLSINFEPSLSLKRLGETMHSTHTYIMTFAFLVISQSAAIKVDCCTLVMFRTVIWLLSLCGVGLAAPGFCRNINAWRTGGRGGRPSGRTAIVLAPFFLDFTGFFEVAGLGCPTP